MKHQIATTPEQSQRLIACGVDPNTADMYLSINMCPGENYGKYSTRVLGEDLKTLPEILRSIDYEHAWSLSALLVLLPMEIRKDGIIFDMMLKAYPNEQECYRWCISYYDMELEATAYYSEAPDPIEACVRIVRTLTDNGYTLNMK